MSGSDRGMVSLGAFLSLCSDLSMDSSDARLTQFHSLVNLTQCLVNMIVTLFHRHHNDSLVLMLIQGI